MLALKQILLPEEGSTFLKKNYLLTSQRASDSSKASTCFSFQSFQSSQSGWQYRWVGLGCGSTTIFFSGKTKLLPPLVCCAGLIQMFIPLNWWLHIKRMPKWKKWGKNTVKDNCETWGTSTLCSSTEIFELAPHSATFWCCFNTELFIPGMSIMLPPKPKHHTPQYSAKLLY